MSQQEDIRHTISDLSERAPREVLQQTLNNIGSDVDLGSLSEEQARQTFKDRMYTFLDSSSDLTPAQIRDITAIVRKKSAQYTGNSKDVVNADPGVQCSQTLPDPTLVQTKFDEMLRQGNSTMFSLHHFGRTSLDRVDSGYKLEFEVKLAMHMAVPDTDVKCAFDKDGRCTSITMRDHRIRAAPVAINPGALDERTKKILAAVQAVIPALKHDSKLVMQWEIDSLDTKRTGNDGYFEADVRLGKGHTEI